MRAEKQKSTVRKKQIARAAVMLIARRGVKGLSVAAVAGKVGLVPSALYRHFKGKEEILEATIDLVREMILNNIRLVRRESSSPLDQLKLFSVRHLQMVREFQAIPRIIFSDEISASHPLRRMAIYKTIRELLGQVAEIVAQGQQLGQIDPALDPETVSILYLGLVQPPAMLWFLSKGRFDIKKHLERAWPVFERAVSHQTGSYPAERGVP
jgi:AcrR family transcriptional regulator